MPRPTKKSKVDMTKKVFNISEVCVILGLSRNSVDKLIKAEQLKAIKAGERRWLIPNWAIDEFLQCS